MIKWKNRTCTKCGKIYWGYKISTCKTCLQKKQRKIKMKCPICKKEFLGTYNQIYCCRKCLKVEYVKLAKVSHGETTTWEIFNRDNFRCIYCGKSSIEDGVKLHVDHISPYSKTNNSLSDNLVTSCQDCNLAKGNKEFSEEIVSRINNLVKQRQDKRFELLKECEDNGTTTSQLELKFSRNPQSTMTRKEVLICEHCQKLIVKENQICKC